MFWDSPSVPVLWAEQAAVLRPGRRVQAGCGVWLKRTVTGTGRASGISAWYRVSMKTLFL